MTGFMRLESFQCITCPNVNLIAMATGKGALEFKGTDDAL